VRFEKSLRKQEFVIDASYTLRNDKPNTSTVDGGIPGPLDTAQDSGADPRNLSQVEQTMEETPFRRRGHGYFQDRKEWGGS
tara:strand:+ start:370 stop:612 length:243 start_codon:yes stop_codon:yes gene_type:complete